VIVGRSGYVRILVYSDARVYSGPSLTPLDRMSGPD
jgi:hypothetical protein